jgi:hypothetical protein
MLTHTLLLLLPPPRHLAPDHTTHTSPAPPTDQLEERLVRVDVLKESLAARQAAQRPVQRQVIRKGGFQKGSDDEDSDFE